MNRLPLELINNIISQLDDDKTLYSAILSCRFLFNSQISHLYRLNADNCSSTNNDLEALGCGHSVHACDWASQTGQLATLKRAKDAGITVCDLQRLKWAAEGRHAAAFLYLLEQLDAALDVNSRFPDNQTLLECAVLSGNLEMVKQLVAIGATIEFDPNQENAFHLSVRHGHRDITRYFLAQHIDPSLRGPRDITALHIAAVLGDTETVEWLLAAGLEVDCRYRRNPYDEYTALYDAAAHNHVDVMAVLLEHGADAASTPYGGLSALHIAARNGHTEAASLLLDHGANIDAVERCSTTPLLDAVSNNHLAMIELLVDRGANMSKGSVNWPALALAVNDNNVLAAALLLNKGADIDETEQRNLDRLTALHIAFRNRNIELVELLLSHGASTSIRTRPGYTVLLQAIEVNEFDMVRVLLNGGADVEERHNDDDESLPLSVAACKGYNEIVSLLLDHDADVEGKDKYDCTAVANVASTEHVSTMRLLLERGADSRARAASGYNALVVAVTSKRIEMVRLLLQNGTHGPQPKQQANDAFFWACNAGNMDMIKLFLEYGCDPARDGLATGDLPIHAAARSGNIDLVDFFLQQDGVDLDSRDCFMRTPLFHAAGKGKVQMVKHLLSKGADHTARDIYHATPLFVAMRHEHHESLEPLVAACPESLFWIDALGRTPLQWAELTGPLHLIATANSLLREYGLLARTPEIQAPSRCPLAIPKDPAHHSCDVCTREVEHCTLARHCTICSDDSFLICRDCANNGMVCFDAAHKESSWTDKCKHCRLWS
ncbi:hypothetical protein VHEMI02137 [[Torrubiella] hemipterigena]|uniref:Uncharacterized protein n=1 Tax=[Torrubiella] hemipterigena TaxID=1531966 RepID=A0A0A1T795_9HYPO|nr:hypothetical protein VHEMI02137 [[Torrubiella] hemipterigena]